MTNCPHCGQSMPLPGPTGVIYMIHRIGTDECYIGSSTNYKRRRLCHRSALRGGYSDVPALQATWDKHGESAFEFVVLFSVTAAVAVLRDIEQEFIDARHPSLNTQPARGFVPGHQPTAATRARLSAAGKGKPHPWKVEHARQLGLANRGVKLTFTPEHRAKLSAAAKRRAVRP